MHGGGHLGGQRTGNGGADKDICTAHGIGQGAGQMFGVGHGCQPFLMVGKARRAAGVQDTVFIHSNNVFGTGNLQHLDDGRTGSAGAVLHDLDIFQPLANNLEGVEHAGQHDNRGAVLVVMEYRDIQVALQLRFNIKALRAADILQVDAAKSRSDGLDSGNNFLAGGSIQADGERIDTAELLKQNALAFHDRQTSFGADVAQAQHSSTVCDNCHGAALEGVFIHIVRVRLDLAAGSATPGV